MSIRARVPRLRSAFCGNGPVTPRHPWPAPDQPEPIGPPVIEFDDTGVPVAVICRDRTRRTAGTTGLEGALKAACDQVKVPLVPVIEPREIAKRREDGGTINHFAAHRQYSQLVAAIPTVEEWRELPNGDRRLSEYAIDYNEAVKRFGRHTHDVCERIPGRAG